METAGNPDKNPDSNVKYMEKYKDRLVIVLDRRFSRHEPVYGSSLGEEHDMTFTGSGDMGSDIVDAIEEMGIHADAYCCETSDCLADCLDRVYDVCSKWSRYKIRLVILFGVDSFFNVEEQERVRRNSEKILLCKNLEIVCTETGKLFPLREEEEKKKKNNNTGMVWRDKTSPLRSTEKRKEKLVEEITKLCSSN